MSAQAQSAQSSRFAETSTTAASATETEDRPVRSLDIDAKIAGYAALCTESLDSLSTAIHSFRAYGQSIAKTRSAVEMVAPTLIKLTKKRHDLEMEFSAAVKAAISACTTSLLAENADSEALLSTVDAQCAILARLKAELADKSQRNELGLVLLSSVMGELIMETHGVRHTAYLHSSDCAEAREEVERGAERLWSELNMLQTFEVAQKSGADAVQAVMRWKKRFELLSPVRQQMDDVTEQYNADLQSILELFDTELSFGVVPETAELIVSLFDVLDKAIEAAKESVGALTTSVD